VIIAAQALSFGAGSSEVIVATTNPMRFITAKNWNEIVLWTARGRCKPEAFNSSRRIEAPRVSNHGIADEGLETVLGDQVYLAAK
jgi:hypothetical protein